MSDLPFKQARLFANWLENGCVTVVSKTAPFSKNFNVLHVQTREVATRFATFSDYHTISCSLKKT